jgi:hypothetical protein
MNSGNTRSWQEFFVAATVVAALQTAFLQPSAEAAVDGLSIKSPLASISTLPVKPGATSAGTICEGCSKPAPLHERVTDLVITTTLPDGGYVVVWQNKYDNFVYGQSYSRENRPKGDIFRLDAEVKDGVLPIVLGLRDGGFVARWQQDGQHHEQRFDPYGVPLGNAAQ